MASSAAQAPQQKSFDEVAKQATSARNEDRAIEAIGLYREAVRMRPSWDQGWLWLGGLLYDQDRFPEAQDAFAHFAAITPKPGAALAYLGLCEYETHDFTHSMEHMQKWVDAGYPGDKSMIDIVAFHRALLLMRQGNFGAAYYLLFAISQREGYSPPLIEALGLVSLRIPNLPEDYPPELRERVWLTGKADFYALTHEFGTSQEYSNRLLARYGQQPNVHYFYGTLLNIQHRPAEAVEEFLKELQISPRHVPAMVELAQIELDAGNFTEAASQARRAAEIEPADPLAHHLLGRALLATGQVKESVQELESAERLAPNNISVHFQLAKAYQELGRPADVKREMSKYAVLKEKEEEPKTGPSEAPQ